MRTISGFITSVLLLTLSLAHGGALWVSNSKGSDTNQLVDKDGTLLTESDPVIVAIGTFASEPAAAIPGSTQNLGGGIYAALLAEFSSYGSPVGILEQAGAADRRGSFIFQDDQPVAGTPLEGKPVYVLVAKGSDLAGAGEVAIIKTDEVFEASDDDSPLPKLVGVGTGLGSTVIVGSDALFGTRYNLAGIVMQNPPTDLALSPDTVIENDPSGTTVGTISATDADAGDSFTYTLVAGTGDTDNGLFTIDGDELKTAATFDHEVQPGASIRVRVVDSYGLDYEEALTVTITDDRGEDFDMDGLTEAEEEDIHGTSDTDPDSDDDGFEDGFEVAYGFDPVSDLDGTGDRDDDGSPDWLEDRLGTDGDVPGPGLALSIREAPSSGQPMVRVGPGGTLLGFSIERSITLEPPWEEVADFPVGLPIGQSIEWVDHSVPAYPVMYRVHAFPLPLPVTAPDGFTWVTVGDPANPADPATGHGVVAAEFQIAAHEVTIGQWVGFLNAKEASEPVDPAARLYHASMAGDSNIAGIVRNGADGSYTYEAIGSPERPVTFVSWLDAARYVNWLHNGMGGATTESGVYDMSLSPELITRAPGASYFLPNRDEWYKAAYYDPTKGGSNYWPYPTRSDTVPSNDLSSGPNFANFGAGGDYTLTPEVGYSATTAYLTLVGSFAGSASHYGTFDQGGSVWEWTETLTGTNREGRGGAWGNGSVHLLATSSRDDSPATENAGIGIRIAKPSGP